MKRALIVVALLVVVAIVLGLRWLYTDEVLVHPVPRSGSGMPIAGSGSAPSKRTYEHATKVSPDEHRRLADDIARAQAAHAAAHSAPSAPKLPELGSDDLARIQDHVLKALQEAIPFLAECYKQHAPDRVKGGITAVAQMTLTGDPDIGTVVDADQIYDAKHQPLAKALDDCIRNTMQTLALPPLDTGDSVRIEYSFRFEDDGSN